MGKRYVWIFAAGSVVLSVLSFIADLPGKIAGMTTFLKWLDFVPGWGWGVAFLLLAIAIPVHDKLTRIRHDHHRQEQIEQRRRQLIKDWRAMMARIAQWYRDNAQEGKDVTDELMEFIVIQPEYRSLHPYLDKSRSSVDRTIVVNSGTHGRIVWLDRNIDRLERKWNVLES